MAENQLAGRLTPKWGRWLALPAVQLWEAVALSLDLAPESMPAWLIVKRFSGLQTERLHPEMAELLDRLAFCQRAVSVSGPIRPHGSLYMGINRDPMCSVRLAEVAAFLVAAGESLPMQLLDGLAIVPTNSPTTPRNSVGQMATTECEATAVPAVEVPAGDTPLRQAKGTTNRISTKSDPLTAVLNSAKSSAEDCTDWNSVWASLVRLAERESRPAPLIGYAEGEGVQYRTDDTDEPVKYLSREAFRKRFSRQQKTG